MGIVVTGKVDLKDVGTADALNGTTIVDIKQWSASAHTWAECTNDNGGLRCRLPENDGAWTSVSANHIAGTFKHYVPITKLTEVQLSVAAHILTGSSACRDRFVGGETQCVSSPIVASGHAVADPYLYIDPAWEYASYFTIEMATDETDTTWVTPERTPFDPVTLGAPTETNNDGGVDADAGGALADAGSAQADAGAGNPGAGDPMPGTDTPDPNGGGTVSGLDGSVDGESEKQRKDDGGCQLAHGVNAGGSWFFALSMLTLYRRGRRRKVTPRRVGW
jgi:hypothetical protein